MCSKLVNISVSKFSYLGMSKIVWCWCYISLRPLSYAALFIIMTFAINQKRRNKLGRQSQVLESLLTSVRFDSYSVVSIQSGNFELNITCFLHF